MDWIVEYEDGQVVTSSDCSWARVPRDKNVSSIGVYDSQGSLHSVDGDVVFFSDLGSTLLGRQGGIWEARMVAGFNRATGKGKMITVYTTGGYDIEDVNLKEHVKDFGPVAFIYNEIQE